MVKWLVHGIAECSTCGWVCQDYLTVQKKAAAHSRTTGHMVRGEVGYAIHWGQQATKPKKREGKR